MSYAIDLDQVRRLSVRFDDGVDELRSIVRTIETLRATSLINPADPDISVRQISSSLQNIVSQTRYLIDETVHDVQVMRRTLLEVEKADNINWTHEALDGLGLLPDEGKGPLKWPLYTADLGLLGVDIGANYLEYACWKSFNPKIPIKGWSPQQLYSARPNSAHWATLAGHEYKVAQLGKVTKWAGRIGNALTFALASWEEWNESGLDPSLDSTERVVHSATVGATTLGGAMAGAKVGTAVGAAIGTVLMPGVGTAVGAVIGGYIGGMAGSYAGEWIGHQIKYTAGEIVSEEIEKEIENYKNLASAATLISSHAAKNLSFWD